MKPARSTAFLAALVLLLAPVAATAGDAKAKAATPRTITQVVKLLETMLQKSKDDGNEERELFAKYKCYCDTNEQEKTDEIDRLTKEIAVLEAKIEELQSGTGKLSKEVAKLDKDMAENEQSRNDAESIREKEKNAFDALETDLTTAIGQMDEAIQTLADIGADQSLGESAADHKQMMAGFGEDASLITKKLRQSVKQALLAASSFVSPHQKKTVESFIQAPFTGTYSAQSGEVVGILKDMRDTFKANLNTARKTEATAIEAHDKFMKTAQEAYDEMDAAFTEKQGQLGDNDGDLATKKTQLADAVSSKEDAEAFLEQLVPMCKNKAKEYKNRVMMRANEEAAIAEAISILNSDAAFATFGGASATKDGATSFVQVRAHKQVESAVPAKAQKFLAAKAKTMPSLAKVAAMVQAGNPFKTVLEEIKKMIEVLAEEGKKDQEQFDWCKKEREENNAELDTKKEEITTLEGEIDELDTTINDPETGLKVQISNEETALEENIAAQKEQTKQRTEDNLAYQKDIANLVEASALLEKAVKVLDSYYSKIVSSDLLQKSHKKEEPAPPSTWDEGGYKGQSEDGGKDAISMLEFILSETKKEEEAAHDAEKTSQHDYEDSMTTLKEQQEESLKTLAGLKEQLAEKEEELLAKEEDLKKTTKEKEAIEKYLLKIKPGCDFIVENLDKRNTARSEEKAALENAETLIKGSPAYTEAMDKAHQESLGDCKEVCNAEGENHVKCKACLADTSVPGYCAGHSGTTGC